ncbi:type IV pilus modification PilV family protein [Halomonas urumqiensis]|uniref:General secretion pathway protein GspH n=1 Tax=Halomonas urumqiensis TaxID=1684789 RepID=A0A2N7UP98_9GAMM|nr:prepilin-type N-terminal cleavage/methylation domain-containing protein [Halomonas urumqiensis]PMR82258.1 general secretion pathway protein GspH [Halomonas urumqiensis]PTB02964.1 prepilin-type N-terminal cleavage/methylation domain-containing protein [Halomonas urumqiensis]GHE20919.1 hypothetical protein GCM10017767_14400 [Halomonas urumqiensis]
MNTERQLHQRRCAGFSLVEVLVAFAVLALVLGAALSVFTSGLRVVSVGGDISRALTIAESLLAESGLESPLAEGQEQGVLKDAYQWQRRVSHAPWWTEQAALDTGLAAFEIHVTVSWVDAGRQRQVALSTLRPQRVSP